MRRIYQLIGILLLSCTVLLVMQSAWAKEAQKEGEFSLQQFGMSLAQIKKAAADGDADAQYALGYMYYYGKDVTKDQQAAAFWIGKAAAQGQPQAVKAQQLLSFSSQTQKPANAHTASTANNPNNTVSASATSDNDNTAATATSVSPSLNARQAQGQPSDNDTLTTTNTVNPNQGSPDQAPARQYASPQSSSAWAQNNSNNPQANVAKIRHPHATTAHKKMIMPSSAAQATSITIKKLLAAPPYSYTLQLLGAYRHSDAQTFIRKHHLENKAMVYKTTFKDKPWFVVIYGIYSTETAAKAGVQTLPTSVQQLNPWIKPMSVVKIALQK